MDNQPTVVQPQPADAQQLYGAPNVEPAPTVDPTIISEPAEEKSWLQKIWGIVLFVVLLGSVVGFLLWWLWIKSPLSLVIKILLTLIPIGLVIWLV